MINQGKTLAVFFHRGKDEPLFLELKEQLKTGGFAVWSTLENIKSGDNTDEKIKEGISQADAIVLVITASFLASDTVFNYLLPLVLQSQKPVFVIIAKACAWQRFKDTVFKEFEILPADEQPIWPKANRDAILTAVVTTITHYCLFEQR